MLFRDGELKDGDGDEEGETPRFELAADGVLQLSVLVALNLADIVPSVIVNKDELLVSLFLELLQTLLLLVLLLSLLLLVLLLSLFLSVMLMLASLLLVLSARDVMWFGLDETLIFETLDPFS